MYLPVEKAELVLALLLEGNSASTVERVTDVHHTTILKLLVLAGGNCERIMAQKVRNVEVRDVEADEIWSLIGKKQKRVRPDDDQNLGDCYVFVAIERHCPRRIYRSGFRGFTRLSQQPHALTLQQIRERLQLLDIYLVLSPPAPVGMMYFGGNTPGVFPYARGPVYYLVARTLNAIIPAAQIRTILRHLKVAPEMFWGIEDHRRVSTSSDTPLSSQDTLALLAPLTASTTI